MTTVQQTPKTLFNTTVIVLLLICFITICVYAAVFFLIPPGPTTVDGYMNEYGGNPDIYQRILSISYCAALQTEFDLAVANNERLTPGTPEHKWSTGYMTAAKDRMKEIGCTQ